jgi:glycosyltransferase involved in cell wall biosynthesis
MIKLGLVTDSALIDSGYGKIAREVFSRLNSTKEFQISQLGWWARESKHNVAPWNIYKTQVRDGQFLAQDSYGQLSFDAYYEKERPDIVWSTGDPWMIDSISKSKYAGQFKHIYYMPIDYDMISPTIKRSILGVDKIVSYTQYGADVLRENLKIDTPVITPGVDHEIFRPYADRANWKKDIFGLGDNDMLVGFFSRNTSRKNIAVLLRAIGMCRNKFKKDNIYAYLHCHADDEGPDIGAMIYEFSIKGGVFLDGQISMPCIGVSEQSLATSMNICDLVVLPSVREGFGMTGLEAMACGRKTYVTRCTGMLEYGINFLDPVTRFRESNKSMYTDAHVVDAKDLSKVLLKELKNMNHLKGQDIPSTMATERFSWNLIARQWYDLIKEESATLFKGKQWQILTKI